MNYLEKNNSGKGKAEKGQFERANQKGENTILERKHLKKDNSGKEKSEKDNSGKGKTEKGSF